MHELGLATEILRISEESLKRHGRGRIERVRLAVGELAAVEPDLLRFAWEALTGEGPHAGSELVIEWRRARQLCPACDQEKERAEGDWLRACPDCGHALQITGGRELDILNLEVSLEDDAAAVEAAGAQGRDDGQDG